ncbi:DctP family TRAP transporter solute-binding subunit [Salinicola rhizosphaerae]|uniref:ABC transporter substrate-binding protein n=1 Tax=Salinicola rhizosphaerae TaxID=1443141 RepID=A0ABQ3E3T2_9GAMM|nr:DctP family TRAP transporter solute-binding subunit [Salinicola rhizosphaerae]GHB21513.1 ABC transporter substrate-binding protein [Salinicola rhizosphaerae]
MHPKTLLYALSLTAGLMVVSSGAQARDIKVGHFGAPGKAFDQGVQVFIDKLDELSNGEMTATDYPGGQLGNESQEIASLRGGLQEVFITSSTNMIRFSPKFQLIDLPFLFDNDAEADKVLLGPIGDDILGGLDGTGLHGLTFWDNGFRDLSNSQHPITQLSDFEGLDFRVIGEPIFVDTFKALGANPVPLPFPEIYSALETGTVDGQDNPLLTVRDVNFFEVQDYLTDSKHAYSAMVVLVGQPFWNQLSDAQKAIVQQAAEEAGQAQRQIMRKAVSGAKAFLAGKGGMEVDSFDAAARKAIRKAVQPVIDGVINDDNRDLYQQIQQTLSDMRQPS